MRRKRITVGLDSVKKIEGAIVAGIEGDMATQPDLYEILLKLKERTAPSIF